MGTGCSKITLKEVDYVLLESKFSRTRKEIDRIFEDFKEKCPEGRLNKRQFEELLSHLWSESIKTDGYLLDLIFSTFDANGSGYVTLEEFLITCSEQETFDKSTIESVFHTYYDKDRKGTVNFDNIKSAFSEICKMYPGHEEELNVEDIEYISQEFYNHLLRYSENPYEINKESFIQGIINNPILASFMIPCREDIS